MPHTLPNDPIMLLSLVNTELRDHYGSLSRFCHAYCIDEKELTDRLKSIDYIYDPTCNQFV